MCICEVGVTRYNALNNETKKKTIQSTIPVVQSSVYRLPKNSLGLLKKGATKQSRIKNIMWHLRWLVRTRVDISLQPSGLVRPRADIKLQPSALLRTRTDIKLRPIGLVR